MAAHLLRKIPSKTATSNHCFFLPGKMLSECLDVVYQLLERIRRSARAVSMPAKVKAQDPILPGEWLIRPEVRAVITYKDVNSVS